MVAGSTPSTGLRPRLLACYTYNKVKCSTWNTSQEQHLFHFLFADHAHAQLPRLVEL